MLKEESSSFVEIVEHLERLMIQGVRMGETNQPAGLLGPALLDTQSGGVSYTIVPYMIP